MSIVVLKRKSSTKYGKISSSPNHKIFSINNPRRIGRHPGKGQTQTPMKGTAYRGHGTCCGTYPINVLASNYVNYDPYERDLNASDKVTTGISVKNNFSSISTRNKWIKSTYPNYIVKNMQPKDYETYIAQKAAQNASKSLGEESITQDNCELDNVKCNKKSSDIVKRVDTMSQSEYMKTKLLAKNCLPTPNSKAPCPQPLSGPCMSCNGRNDGCSDPADNDNNNTETEKGSCT